MITDNDIDQLVQQIRARNRRQFRNDCFAVAGAIALFLAGLVTICWALW